MKIVEYIVDKHYIEIEAKFVNKWCLMLSVSVSFLSLTVKF